MQRKDRYFLGLDIGTESVGWAVTTPDYKLVKRNGKALWGVRLFDEAQTAEERRGYRVARRRIERRAQRLKWLQEVFAPEIGKVDPGFFQRLRESKFLEEDKKGTVPLGKYTLFADKEYTDKEYHKQFPTVYHLRKALIEQTETFDVRLVYLAVYHIMKYRGHFLYGDLPLETISLENGLERLSGTMEERLGKTMTVQDMDLLKQTLISRSLKKVQRKKQLAQLFSVSKEDGACFAVVELLAGGKVSLNDLYEREVSNEEISKINLEDEFDSVEDKLVSALGDDMELILAVKEIYDWARLETMRDGEQYLSFAKVKAYEKHHRDLERLKAAIRTWGDRELYREIFHQAKDKRDNYPAYAGMDAANYRCDYDAFRKYIKNKLKGLGGDDPEIQNILDELEQGTFLPKQTSKDNGVIPHQLHEAELVKILERASTYLSFLDETDASGLTKREQIHEMFRFRIPYYVGPLDSRPKSSWIVRKNEKIYPWNFDQVVDLEECRRGFITRMTAKCSYIGEDVLPKSSLLYTKFMVLNELNKLRINGKGIPVETKQRIYQDLFLEGKKVTGARLRSYLALGKEDEITGFDQDVKADLAPWKHYAWLLTRPGGMEAAEEIIRHITLFGKERKLLQGWLKKTYGSLITEEEQKKALAFRCSGLGRLSRQFLTGIYHTDPDTGEAWSIMDMLWRTNDNLMELLSGRYTFAQSVEEYRKEEMEKQSMTLQDYLDKSYASPSIKRAIHQVVAIVGEIEGIMKCPPDRIFLEMARGGGEKGKRTVSRKAELVQLYQKCGEEADGLFEQLSQEEDGKLRRDKLYLYYTQMGKCMYSGEAIDLSRLDSDYDIDHIYPQSKTKDDSIQNRVLVKRELNSAKGDKYPIAQDVREKMRPFWTMLEKKGFLSKEKYQRLIRATPFTVEEQAGFINRQLVETRQSSKIVAELLQRRFGEKTQLVYVKAGNVSSFRQDQRLTLGGQQKQASQCKGEKTVQDPLFVKCREINDYHHAKDAYLNIVVGNVYHVKFTCNPVNFLREKDARYSLNRMFDVDVQRGGERAWTAGPEGSIATVRHAMGKNNILFTRRASEVKGGYFDQMIVAKGKGQMPIKSGDPRMDIGKYGGYNKLTGAYFALVEHTDKKKRVRSLETVLLIHKGLYETNPEEYCRKILELKDPKVLIPKVKINSLLSFDGFRMHISGRTGVQIIYKNANPLVMAPQWHQYVKGISRYMERCKAAGQELSITSFDKLTAEENRQLYQLLREKLENPLYRIKFETAARTFRENEERFAALTVADQCRILLQMLNLFANNAASADLKLLNGKIGIGILLTSKKISTYAGSRICLIHPSVTGFFEQEVDLLAEELS